jgi:hypothetical protein
MLSTAVSTHFSMESLFRISEMATIRSAQGRQAAQATRNQLVSRLRALAAWQERSASGRV